MRFNNSKFKEHLYKALSNNQITSKFKLVLTLLILFPISLGFYNIYQTVDDYYRYDVITNIERIEPHELVFPAITICTARHFYKEYYENNTRPNETLEYTTNIDFRQFIRIRMAKTSDKNANQHLLELFEIPYFDSICVRFNGGINRTLRTIQSNTDYLELKINNEYYQDLSSYLRIKYTVMNSYFAVFIEDNYLNSFLKSVPIHLNRNNQFTLLVEKTEIETKLGEPYNKCDESLDKKYRQMNCIEICINKEINLRHKCSIPSYYDSGGLKRCVSVIPESQSIYSANHLRLHNLTNGSFERCASQCRKQCETQRFSLKTVDSYSKENYTRFVFKVLDLSSFKIKQIPKVNGFSLVSAVGGSLGLFVGVRSLLIDVLFMIFNRLG